MLRIIFTEQYFPNRVKFEKKTIWKQQKFFKNHKPKTIKRNNSNRSKYKTVL